MSCAIALIYLRIFVDNSAKVGIVVIKQQSCSIVDIGSKH